MTTSSSCPIKLLDKTYEIKCPEHEIANLKQAGEKLNKQLSLNKKKFKQLDDFQNALLAALQMSHELLSCQKQQKIQWDNIKSLMKNFEKSSEKAPTESSFLDPVTE